MLNRLIKQREDNTKEVLDKAELLLQKLIHQNNADKGTFFLAPNEDDAIFSLTINKEYYELTLDDMEYFNDADEEVEIKADIQSLKKVQRLVKDLKEVYANFEFNDLEIKG